MAQGWKITDNETKQAFISQLDDLLLKGPVVLKLSDDVTPKQFRSLNLWCDLLAETLNSGGYSVLKVLKQDAEIPWTGSSVKEHLWKPIQAAMYNTGSTTELKRKECGQVVEVLSRHLAESIGIDAPPFPSNYGN